MRIERATPGDLPDVLRLLEQHHLPLDGVEEQVATMIVAKEDGRLVGVAAAEFYADGALLRSVAVDPSEQRKGLGQQLTVAALAMIDTRGVDAVFLLTTTAENFFPRFGFERITRTEVPASVRKSVEFQSACPDTAIVMRKRVAARQS